MNLPNWSLKWKDAVNAIIMMIIGQALMIVMQAADAEFPSIEEFKIGLIGSIKYAVIPYILKNFFTDDIKAAQKTLSKAKVEGIQAAEPIPPPLETEKINLKGFPDSTTIPKPENKP